MGGQLSRFIVMVAVALLLVAVAMNGCGAGVMVGSGKSMTETREVSNFDGVAMSFVGDVEIVQGDEEKLVIIGDDNIVPLIKTEVQNGLLEIRTGPGIVAQPAVPLRYTLYVKELANVTLSGLANLHTADLRTERLTVVMSGAGNISVDALQADEVSVMLSGLGNATLGGEANRQRVDVSGAGSYTAGNLASAIADISLTGLGNATVRASEVLRINISGAGSVEYYGNPEVSKAVSGLGTIVAKGE